MKVLLRFVEMPLFLSAKSKNLDNPSKEQQSLIGHPDYIAPQTQG